MEKETLDKLRNSMQFTKESASKVYHKLADCANKTYNSCKEKKPNQTLKMSFAKYLLVFLDILYMLISLVMINIGVAGKFLQMSFSNELNSISSCWIATGIILMLASIFGLIGAFKESNVWTNIFGIVMMIVFAIQISTTIYIFHFIGDSQSMATYSIHFLMDFYSYYKPLQKIQMDWIQRNFQCCGHDGPSDWSQYPEYRLSNYNGYNSYPWETVTTTTLSPSEPIRTPSSCCAEGSNYIDSVCKNVYENGCAPQLHDIVSETIMIVGCISLAIAVFQILGIALAFVVAKMMRETKSFVAVKKYGQLNAVQNSSDAEPSSKLIENDFNDLEAI